METRKTELGPEHPNTLTSMANLASTYQNQGRWMEAEKLEVQVMETSKTVLGPEHPDTLTNMWNLSHTWKKQGRDSHALELLEACVQLQRKQLGLTHPNTIAATADLEAWGKSIDISFSPSPNTSDSQADGDKSATLRPGAQVESSLLRSQIDHRSQQIHIRRGLQSIYHPLLSALRLSDQAVESPYDESQHEID
jgi:hypothetical protein